MKSRGGLLDSLVLVSAETMMLLRSLVIGELEPTSVQPLALARSIPYVIKQVEPLRGNSTVDNN
jgi:hypothetical protein